MCVLTLCVCLYAIGILIRTKCAGTLLGERKTNNLQKCMEPLKGLRNTEEEEVEVFKLFLHTTRVYMNYSA